MAITLRHLNRADLAAATAMLEVACAFDRAAAVAAEKLYGAAPGVIAPTSFAACDGDRLLGVAVASGNRIRLLAVHPEARRRGLGTALLAAAESACAAACAAAGRPPVVRAMDQPGNYLAPGIDRRDSETIAWMERRGYTELAATTNLLIAVRGNPQVSPARALELAQGCAAAGYAVRRARRDEMPALAGEVGAAFQPAWAFEVERALAGAASVSGVHVAHAPDGALAAFAVHDGNNQGLGWFGPTGTLPAHRGQGLGAALLLACLVEVAAAHEVCEVAWVGPRGFYERTVGAAGERRFTVMSKDLSA